MKDKIDASKILIELLKPFEIAGEYFEENKVAIAIRKFVISNKDLPTEIVHILEAEHTAFNFGLYHNDGINDDKNFYKARNVDVYGNLIEGDFKITSKITAETVKYWQERCERTISPILRARYADILWTFGKGYTDNKTRVTYLQIAIETYLYIFNKKLFKNHFDAEDKLKRALYLALIVKDKTRIRRIGDTFFKLFYMAADISKPGLWGIIFDNLYGNKNIFLTKKQKTIIIDTLEMYLYQTTDFKKKKRFSPWGAMNAVKRLLQHYHKNNQTKDIKRIVRRYGLAFEKIAQEADPLLAMAWLQPVYELYKKEGLTKDSIRVQLNLKLISERTSKSFKRIESRFTIDQKELNRFINVLTRGGYQKSFIRIAIAFIPKIGNIRKILQNVMKQAPLTLHIPQMNMADGQIISRINGVDSDLNGHIISEIANNISISYIYLTPVIDRLIGKYKINANKLSKFIFKTPIIESTHYHLITRGLYYYIKKDFIGAIHLLVPQIEYILRCLLAALGQPTNKPGIQPGTMQEKNINDVLSEPAIKKFLPNDFVIYYKTFLSDPRGYNLRNRLSHGLIESKHFNRFFADRLIHILLTLSLVRKK